MNDVISILFITNKPCIAYAHPMFTWHLCLWKLGTEKVLSLFIKSY